MKSTMTIKVTAALTSASAGAFLALLATASPASADPVDSAAPPAPVVAVAAPPAVNVQAAGTDVAPLPPGPADADPAPPPAVNVQAAGTAVTPLPPNGVPHLASPDALPPGSTMDSEGVDSPNVGYLKDLWQAVQNHEISGKEALVMGFAQRGMNTPYPQQAPGPNVPITPGDAPAPPAPDAPAAAPAPAPATP